MPLLTISNLTVSYRHGRTWQDAVRDVSLTIAAGQTVGLVGESGSGKSTIALALMRYLGPDGRVRRGQIQFDGRDLLALAPEAMRAVWGREISLVPQDPFSSLNPAIRVGEQVAEPLRRHLGLNQKAAAQRALALLEMARIPDPARVARSYPHQLSGGMQQRVMLAMALGTEPKLLVLDEPTTNLDVTTQAAVLDLLADLIRERDTAVLYVTHNLGVVAHICDRVAVLYAGELVEDAPTAVLYRQPIHPYTRGLLDSVPQLGQNKRRATLPAIPGRIPPLADRPAACVFAPRCPLAIEICHGERPSLAAAVDDHAVRCHRWPEIVDGSLVLARPAAPQNGRANLAPSPQTDAPSLLDLTELQVHFDVTRSLAEVITSQPAAKVRAVDGVNLAVGRGQTLGLVGESGSGKTTLARAVIGLAQRTGGAVELLGFSLPASLSDRDLAMLKRVQYIFQNPEEALNPYLSVGETLRRPFISLMGLSKAEADERAAQLLTAVHLPPDYARRLPGQLSGGEKQRVAIARAFAASPDLLIADEAVSALDVSVQAGILNLLTELQTDTGNTLLFISHDLAVVGYLADRIAVMYLGHLMEVADADALFAPPFHPYTEALLSAIPVPDPQASQTRIHLDGDAPSQLAIPSGCPFHPRCPRYLGDVCRTQTPPWQETETGGRIFCYIPLEELKEKQLTANNQQSTVNDQPTNQLSTPHT